MSARHEPIGGGGPACGCCEPGAGAVPAATANRPGLDALRYRIGDHAGFLDQLLAQISRMTAGGDEREVRPLLRLGRRTVDDPSIALLDAWAVLADVLTFYQERIAGEGYLRTARERRSLVELGRLIGYAPRPGVAASVHLAFTAAENYDEIVIPAGTRGQSVPAEEGEMPQAFETARELTARAAWNALAPRLERRQAFSRLEPRDRTTLWLEGTGANLRPGDPLWVAEHDELYRVLSARPDDAAGKTEVVLGVWRIPPEVDGPPPPAGARERLARALAPFRDLAAHGVNEGANARRVLDALAVLESEAEAAATLAELTAAIERARELVRAVEGEALDSGWTRIAEWTGGLSAALEGERTGVRNAGSSFAAEIGGNQSTTGGSPVSAFLAQLDRAPSVPPASALQLPRSLAGSFEPGSQASLELLTTVRPRLRGVLYSALAGTVVTPPPAVAAVDALRVEAAPFGATAPLESVFERNEDDVPVFTGREEWNLTREPRNVLALDAVYAGILPGSAVVVERPDRLVKARVLSVRTVSKAAYDITGKVTELTLDQDWLFDEDRTLATVRQATVYARAESLALAPVPIDPVEESVGGDTVELDGLYPGLEPGRWLIFRGERTDVPGAEGVPAAELAMIAGVTQGADREVPGDRPHTTLELAAPLAYRFRRDSVTIHGNVLEATHGESRSEVLGSGDGARGGQTFALSFTPVTYVAAPEPDGVAETLEVRVDDVLWQEAPDPAALGPGDRRYLLRTDDDGTTTVTFGDGRHGARLPTGSENVTAEYRQGIGAAGNVAAGQISQLATRPLGVEGVLNPLPATGGADRDGPETIRRNAPLAVGALDRLVSVADHADFARTFAGVAKADAVLLSDGRRRIVHLTIAGVGDAPIAETSDLLRNLRQAIGRFGDPHQPFTVAVRELLLLVLSARLRIAPDHRWESVEPAVRAALLDAFSFERRELGRDVALSEVIAAAQSVPGVLAVDVDVLDRVSEGVTPEELEELSEELELRQRVRAERARPVPPDAGPDAPPVLPAQLAYLSPDLPGLLILTEWTP
jgi:predicted phage baseplate assembly protein